MCLGQQQPSAPKPQPLPPATPPPPPAPEPAPAPTDLQANKEGTKLKAKTSAREKLFTEIKKISKNTNYYS